MLKRVILNFLLLILFMGCATSSENIRPTINHFVGSRDFAKYKNIAVLPFTDAPNAPQSGQIIQGIASQIFAQSGFIIAERARLYNLLSEQKLSTRGLIETNQAVQIGKILGVRAVVVGEVGQYSIMQRHTDTAYYPLLLPTGGHTSYIPIQGEQWNESYVSVSLRVIDVETSQLIYSGSGTYDRGLQTPPQQLAEYILKDIVVTWVRDPYQLAKSQQKTQNESSKAIDQQFNPNDASSYNKRARAHYNLGNYQQAISDFSKIIELFPNHPGAYNNRAITYNATKNYHKAIEDCNKAIQLDTKTVNAYHTRGVAFFNLGINEQATNDWKTAARLGNKESQGYLTSKGIIWQ
jgi:tetratricopeptide (TPR) repeat protein